MYVHKHVYVHVHVRVYCRVHGYQTLGHGSVGLTKGWARRQVLSIYRLMLFYYPIFSFFIALSFYLFYGTVRWCITLLSALMNFSLRWWKNCKYCALHYSTSVYYSSLEACVGVTTTVRLVEGLHDQNKLFTIHIYHHF